MSSACQPTNWIDGMQVRTAVRKGLASPAVPDAQAQPLEIRPGAVRRGCHRLVGVLFLAQDVSDASVGF